MINRDPAVGRPPHNVKVEDHEKSLRVLLCARVMWFSSANYVIVRFYSATWPLRDRYVVYSSCDSNLCGGGARFQLEDNMQSTVHLCVHRGINAFKSYGHDDDLFVRFTFAHSMHVLDQRINILRP